MNDQQRTVLAALRRGPITTGELWAQHGIGRAGARVLELRGMGYTIHTELVQVPTRQGGTARVARYWLISSPAADQDQAAA